MQKASVRITKNAKRGTGTNKRTNTDTLDPYDLFLKGTETKYEMKTECVLISKKQKQIQKTRRRRDGQSIRQKSCSI